MNKEELLNSTINLEEYGGSNIDSISVKGLLEYFIDRHVKDSLRADYNIEEGNIDRSRVFNGMVFKKLANQQYVLDGISATKEGIAYEGQIQFDMIFESTNEKQDGFSFTIDSKWQSNLPLADGNFIYDIKANPIGEVDPKRMTAYNGAGVIYKMIKKQVKPLTTEEIYNRTSNLYTEYIKSIDEEQPKL